MSILEIIIYSLIGCAVVAYLTVKLFKKPKAKKQNKDTEEETFEG